MFFMILLAHSDCFPKQHQLIGSTSFSQCSRNWMFTYN